MEYLEIVKNHKKIADIFIPIIKDTAEQLLQNELSFSLGEFIEGDNSKINTEIEYPSVLLTVTFENIPNTYSIIVTPEFTTRFFGYMIADDSLTEFDSEHMDAFKEGVQQILGQLQSTQENTGNAFAVSEVNVELVDEASSVKLPTYFTLNFGEISILKNTFKIAQICEVLDNAAGQNFDQMSKEDNQKEETLNYEADSQTDVSPIELSDFPDSGNAEKGDGNLGRLLDVELEVSVELGRKSMAIEEILKLGKGSIVELNRLAGEPIDILVNKKRLAQGEVVVVDDHFAIRLTNLLSPKERIKSLG